MKREDFNVRLCPRRKNSGKNLSLGLYLINLFFAGLSTKHVSQVSLTSGSRYNFGTFYLRGPQKSSCAMLIRHLRIQSHIVNREIVEQVTLLHKYYVGQAKSGSFGCNGSRDKYYHTLFCRNSSWISVVEWEKFRLDWVSHGNGIQSRWFDHNDLRLAYEIDFCQG